MITQEKLIKEKTKLKCKNGHVWRDVVYTSSALSHLPPLCPKCLKKGIKAVGKPVPIIPLRTRVKGLAKAVTFTPLKYLVAKPVCFVAKYLVAKPVVFTAKVGWFATKMGALAGFMPLRLTWAIGSFPFKLANAILHRIANPSPQVVVIQDSGFAGFKNDVSDEGCFGAKQRTVENPENPGFENEEEEECCECCGEQLCDCGACHCCEDEANETAGFVPEPPKMAEQCMAPPDGRTGFVSEGLGGFIV